MKYGRPFWAAIGEDNAADVAGAANVAARLGIDINKL